MPIYEYQCPDCGHRFDKLQKVSEDPVRICPRCGQEEVKKLVSASAFILKGSGWYKDHYGLKQGAGDGAKTEGGAPAAAKADAPAAKAGSAGSDSASPAASAPAAATPSTPTPSKASSTPGTSSSGS